MSLTEPKVKIYSLNENFEFRFVMEFLFVIGYPLLSTLRKSAVGAVAGEATAADKKEESVDDGKMMRVCDKLIEVFMVDKPTPTDWRRLLAFSKEWTNLRSHFYSRCHERADIENDPGMKHNLLRLARKLREVIFHFSFQYCLNCNLVLLEVMIDLEFSNFSFLWHR